MVNPIRISFSFHFILTLFFLSAHQISAVDYPINVWPKPRTFSWAHPQASLISPNFSIIINPSSSSSSNPFLIRAVKRYHTQILSEKYNPLVTPLLNLTSTTQLQTLTVNVVDPAAPLSHGVNESYSLSIPTSEESTAATLTAGTVWGAMRGLETFSQLVYGNPPKIASGLFVSDAPLYPHRGLMLDTSRNYYPVHDLCRLIKALSMNKLNVFHWHITDSHSFPLVVPSEPELAGKGAYGEDMKYSPEDVKNVVKFGMEHGVRVLPEIDMPAHTGSWVYAYPDIVTCANMFWWPAGADWPDRLAAEPGTGHLNPLSPNTYKVVKNVIHDVLSMFPDSFYHAGADEITPNCWKSDPAIQAYVAKNGTLSQLLEIFVNSTLPYILSQNRTVVYWEDLLLDGNVNVSASLLPKENVILQTWNNGPINTKKIVDAGYRVIVSSSDFYYLDCGHGDFLGNDSQYDLPPGTNQGNGGSWCGPFKTWQIIYNYDIAYGLNEQDAELVIGGEVALWSEQADSTVMDSRIWPRTSALAESLWSGNRDETGKKRYAEATDRLNEWRNRMVKRGIRAEPIQPLWCIRNPGMCNTVHPFVVDDSCPNPKI
ncbi:OLC1v1001723C1 [Oldenlandia corymbosa var. corymbosa]|uniref:Beta-hexosaminidase n=1 Tax=Oldenlandia corymbosa var. corymbosa TaxID=529605 RepID=A0AAV1D8G2_OLDCO|nr:OLC1v1001723C1 [Oldenlandia corymbosa var. corymbosa]